MPGAEEILAGLHRIANQWTWLAVVWHAAFGMAGLALWRGARPSPRTLAALLALPQVCVSALAWMTGNPFNATVFALVAAVMLFIASRLEGRPIVPAEPIFVAAGVVLCFFGWTYPHFLDTASPAVYLVAAPLGLLPCPTLSMAVGITLIFRGLQSLSWCVLLAVLAFGYGAFGAVRLGVTIDAALFAGGLVLVGALRHWHANRAGP